MHADLVLVGGGHAHVQVIRRWMKEPLPGVRLTVVLDRPEAVYSGMVPGWVAGDTRAAELEIDAVPLARRAGARVVLAAATRVDPRARRIQLEERPSLLYDVASLDVGSSVRDLDLPGVRAHALATRPIRGFVDRLEACLARARSSDGRSRVLVVGGGAAGIELAFTLEARLRADGAAPALTVLTEAAELLPGASSRLVRRLRREADRRGIALRPGVRVAGVEEGAVCVEGTGERVRADLVVWATGAAPPPLVADSPLPVDAQGFVRVRSTLQVVGHDALFAAGDAAALDEHPWVPKAGVYAVRQGPVLDGNLRALLGGRPLRHYRPQRDFLTLLHLGDGRAMGSKWGIVAAGSWVRRLKDRIDRRFVRRFQVLEESGRPARGSPDSPAMVGSERACGGCAAKVDARTLARALDRLAKPPEDASVLVGLERPDDAAALRLPLGDLLLASVDGFRSFTDDAFLVGRVAAVNAASDVFAKGGRGRHALALVTVPEAEGAGEETLHQVLAGLRAELDPLAISLVGGHTTAGPELFVALAITGELAEAGTFLGLDGARPDEHLVLTKPLGTGVVLAADMRGRAPARWLRATLASMLRPNAEAGRVAREHGASACTDVSGFGLAGHLSGILEASAASAALEAAAIPVLPGARELLATGLRSTFHARNLRAHFSTLAPVSAGPPTIDLLFDPQTSGGLLFSLPASRGEAAVRALRAAGDREAAVIGVVQPARDDGARIALH